MVVLRDIIFETIKKELEEKKFRFERVDFNRPWGGFFVIVESQKELFVETYYPEENIDNLIKGESISPKILIVLPEKRLSWQYHHRRSEVWKLYQRYFIMTCFFFQALGFMHLVAQSASQTKSLWV